MQGGDVRVQALVSVAPEQASCAGVGGRRGPLATAGTSDPAALCPGSPQVEFLFGKLGTHARIAGATLRVRRQ